ncbi:MAG: hypothetical protein Q7J25_13680 [Vicinamibacterales bacterium]|nr:hypothetical protein [Vicinamibacterales bacterium]
MRIRVAAGLVLVSLCAGCKGSAITTTAPTTTAGTGTDTFTSFLAVGGSSIHSFPVEQTGTITVMLTNVRPAGVVGLGAGVSNAGGCSLIGSLDASAVIIDPTTGAINPQLTIPADVGTYCVKVYDSGQLDRIGRTFSVTITHP